MQFITITGRISADAEVRQAGGNEVTEVRLAVDQGWGDKKQTNWYRVNIWGKKGANSAAYLLKGGLITVVGELIIGEYNGKPQYEVRASDFTLPAKASDNRGSQRGSQQRDEPVSDRRGGFGDKLDDSLPDWDAPF